MRAGSQKKVAPWIVAVAGLYAGSCVPGLTGAPCQSNDNCPSGQFCGSDGFCQDGSGGTGGGTGGAGGGNTGGSGGTGGGGGAGGAGGGGGTGGGGGGCAANTQTDPMNCGSCGNVCATPRNAGAVCDAGSCGRGACQANFFDIDGTATFGCESTCAGKTCTLPDGGTVTTSNIPLHETAFLGKSFVNASAIGGKVQTSGSHRNQGSIGEATPRVDGGIESSNSNYRHRGGFGARVK